MVWPIIIAVIVIGVIAWYYYKKPQGSKGFPLNRFCLGCHKRFPENLSSCPYCGEKYFK